MIKILIQTNYLRKNIHYIFTKKSATNQMVCNDSRAYIFKTLKMKEIPYQPIRYSYPKMMLEKSHNDN